MDRAKASCLCGSVRIETTGQPLRVGICHCLDCRKHSGTLFHSWAVFPRDMVSVTGEVKSYDGRYFCPNCGSPLFGGDDDEFELSLGSLEQPNQWTPTYELWMIRRETWLPAFPGLQPYERDRESDSRVEP